MAAVAFVVLLFSNEGGGAFGAFLALIAAGPLVVLGVLAGTIPLFLVGWLVRRWGRELHPALVIGVGLTFAAALAALLSAATYHARPLSLTLAILLPFTAGSLWALLSLRDETNG